MNRDEFIQVRTDKDENNQKIAAKIKKTDEEIVVLNTHYETLDGTHANSMRRSLAPSGTRATLSSRIACYRRRWARNPR